MGSPMADQVERLELLESIVARLVQAQDKLTGAEGWRAIQDAATDRYAAIEEMRGYLASRAASAALSRLQGEG